MKRILFILSLILTIGVFTDCAGGRATLRLSDLNFPCSMSAFLYGPNGEILVKGKDLETVGMFSAEKNFWGIGYSLISLSSDKEISDLMNESIRQNKGQGIINLKIETKTGAMNAIPVLTFLPFWPGYTNATFTGEIVKMRKI